MNKNFNIHSYSKIHFVGIGGISLSALAKYCIMQGKVVSGSDLKITEITEQLKSLGAKIYLGHHGISVIGKQLVVYSSAVSKDSPELVMARKRKIPLMNRAEFLGLILS